MVISMTNIQSRSTLNNNHLCSAVLPVPVAVIPFILDLIKDHGINIGIDNATDITIQRVNATEGPS